MTDAITTPKIETPERVHRKQSWTLAVAIILFALATVFGIKNGITLGKDKANLQNVGTLSEALKYFHTDQDRYPSDDEYANQKILTPYYLEAMPVPANVSGSCKNFPDYIYKQTSDQSYELQFCLNYGVNGWAPGLNKLQQNGQ